MLHAAVFPKRSLVRRALRVYQVESSAGDLLYIQHSTGDALTFHLSYDDVLDDIVIRPAGLCKH